MNKYLSLLLLVAIAFLIVAPYPKAEAYGMCRDIDMGYHKTTYGESVEVWVTVCNVDGKWYVKGK
jgi:hypothetical protein